MKLLMLVMMVGLGGCAWLPWQNEECCNPANRKPVNTSLYELAPAMEKVSAS